VKYGFISLIINHQNSKFINIYSLQKLKLIPFFLANSY
jgi:hypothetical protein